MRTVEFCPRRYWDKNSANGNRRTMHTRRVRKLRTKGRPPVKAATAKKTAETKTRQSKSQIDRPQNLGKPQMKWGSDVVAEVTRRLDLKYIALVPGASYRGFHDSIVNYLGNRNPQMVICLHEEHAVSIADGYGKVSEEPMAVALHSNV